MERHGHKLIKNNDYLKKEVKLLHRENRNLDAMINRMNSNMSILMEQNEKMKDMYKNEIERLKKKIEYFEDYNQKKEEKEVERDRREDDRKRRKTEIESNMKIAVFDVAKDLGEIKKINDKIKQIDSSRPLSSDDGEETDINIVLQNVRRYL